MPPMPFRLMILVMLLVAAAAALAQAPFSGAGSFATGVNGESHGWVITPATGVHEAAVLHLPPRLDRAAEAMEASNDGMVRQAAMLPKVPVAVAAWDRRLIMVFAPERVRDGARQRHVLMTGITRGPAGQWVSEVEGRRLPALPALPGDGALLAIAGTQRGPAALLDMAEPGGERQLQLLKLTGQAWRDVLLPPGIAEQVQQAGRRGSKVGLVAHPQGIAISVVIDPQIAESGVWLGHWSEEGQSDIDWRWQPLRFATADGRRAPQPSSPLFYIAGQFSYVAAMPGGMGVEVWTLLPGSADGSGTEESVSSAWRLAELPDVTAEWAVAPLAGAGRIAVVWAERLPGRSARGRTQTDQARDGTDPEADTAANDRAGQDIRRHIAEVSVYTGAILYQGPVAIRGPVSPQEMRLLAIMMVALMAVIVIFILRPEPKGPPLSLPPGYALAEPGRRIAASAIDLLAAAFITAQLVDVGLWELLTLRGILMPGGVGLAALLMVAGIGFVLTTLSEWLAGRSLGKFITGCEVVRPIIDRTAEGQIVPSVHPPGPWRVAVRNLVKWTLPPVAMAGLGTPERRHRGDLAAGTVVVIRIEEPEPA